MGNDKHTFRIMRYRISMTGTDDDNNDFTHQCRWTAGRLDLVADELGIGRIYYHSFETGNVLKKIRYSQPPRSLYTDLPRKFCFRLTDEVPGMLARSKVVKRKLKRVKQPRWYRLEL